MNVVKPNEKKLSSEIYRKILEYIKLNGPEKLLQFLGDICNLDEEKILSQRIFLAQDDIGKIINRNGNVMQLMGSLGNGFIYYPEILSHEFRVFLKDVSSKMNKIDSFITNAKLLENLRIQEVRFINNWTESEVLYDREGTIPLRGRIMLRRKRGEVFAISNLFSDKKMNFFDFNVSTSGVYGGYNSFSARGGIYPPVLDDECTAETYYCNFDGVPDLIIKSHNYYSTGDRSSAPCFQSEAYIKDFGFDASLLPNQEELSSVGESENLKVYVQKLMKQHR